MHKIALSGLNANDNPASGIPLAKSLHNEFKIIGLTYDPNESGNYLEIVSKSYLMPYPSLGIEELLTRLKSIQDKENLAMIIPCLDLELPIYIKYRENIEALGIRLVLPSQKNFELRSKSKLALLAKELEVRHPKTYELTSLGNLYHVSQQFDYPFMLKGNAHQALRVQNEENAKEIAQYISSKWGFPLLLQEIIEGDELNLVGVGDGNGQLTGAMSIKKLTTTSLGKIWTAISIEHEGMLKLAERFVAQSSWYGAFELECIVKNAEIHLIEINPRFPSWIYFATSIGINLPQQVVQLAQHLPVTPLFTYPTGKFYVRFTDEIVTDFSHFSTLMTQKEL